MGVETVPDRDGSASVTRPVSTIPIAPPSRIGRYDVIGRLGRGGTSTIYLAVRRGIVAGFHKLVVLKQLQVTHQADPQSVEMFRREARIAALLSHSNIVQTFAVDSDDGHDVIVMEYLDGVPLSMLLKQLRGPDFSRHWPVLVGALAEALNGLHQLHEQQDLEGRPLDLVHRDVKPGNIFLTFDGRVKVIDFGVARIGADLADASERRFLKGTAQYMAPDTTGCPTKLDRRADIFSAAVILWEVLHGQRLWGDSAPREILKHLSRGSLPFATGVPLPSVPQALLDLCYRALSLKPSERPKTARSFSEALVEILEHHGAPAGKEALSALVLSRLGWRKQQRTQEIQRRVEALAAVEPERPMSFSTDLQSHESNALTQSGVVEEDVIEAPVPSRRATVRYAAFIATLTAGMVFAGWQARAPKTVSVELVAHPSNTQFFVDGDPIVGNPAHLELARGSSAIHNVLALAPGHLTRHLALTLERDRHIELQLAVDPEAPIAQWSNIRVEPNVTATVFVDGHRLGMSPLDVSLPRGAHIIRAEAEGYLPWYLPLEVKGGENPTIRATLRPR